LFQAATLEPVHRGEEPKARNSESKNPEQERAERQRHNSHPLQMAQRIGTLKTKTKTKTKTNTKRPQDELPEWYHPVRGKVDCGKCK
jgi:hypothetical protein